MNNVEIGTDIGPSFRRKTIECTRHIDAYKV